MIDEEGGQVGVMVPQEALRLAQERGYDLVEISAGADPPVCKIMDYGRFLYEQNKKQHEARKHQKGHKLKEVKFRPRTDEHDFSFKKNHVIRFLEEGDKVKVIIMFRGREMAHKEIGRDKLAKLVEQVAEFGTPEKNPSMEGRWLSTIIAPKPKPKGAKAKPAAKAAPKRKPKAEPEPQPETGA